MSNSLENVRNKRVHNGHSLGGYTGVWVHLFQDFVDVNWKRLLSGLLATNLGLFFTSCFCFGHFVRLQKILIDTG